MRLNVTQEEQGLHPNEVIVKVEARDGPQYLAINKGSFDRDSTIDIGEPVGRKVSRQKRPVAHGGSIRSLLKRAR